MNRRILLIDADPAFHASLAQQLARYQFEIAVEPDVEQALALAASGLPALLLVSVEEPDKAGFKVFQRCKKGALAKVPIVLMTSSVPLDSFAKHRSLKVHADEYIDKRSVSGDELLGKIDSLIGLGEMTDDDDLGLALEVDEIPLSSDDMVLEETVGEDDADAGDAAQHVDSMVDAETDAAFAALLGDEARFAPVAEPVPPAAPAASAAPPEPLLPRTEPPRASDQDARDASAAVPANYDAGKPQDSGGVEFDSFSRESMKPPVDLIARARQELHDRAAGVVETVETGVEAHESVPAIAIDVEDLEPIEDPPVMVPEPVPPPEPQVDRSKFLDASTVVEARPHAVASARQVQATAPSASPVPDLGLDEIAATEATSDHSGVYDRRALRKMGELERQIAQLKTELDRARATADASARGANREREFLNLREQLIARDKDLQRVKDELRARDRDLADLQDRLRDIEQGRAALEVRAAELEHRSAFEANRAAVLETRGKAYASQLAALQQELEAQTHAATTALAAGVALERDLAEERARRTASASDAERSLRVEREQLVARHQAELTAHHDEATVAREAALRALREELERDHAAALAVAVAGARSEIATQNEHAVDQLEANHGAELARLQAAHDAARAQLTLERDTALAQIASERDTARSAAEDEHAHKIALRETEHAAALAQLRDAAARQLSQVRDELARELAHTAQEAAARLAETKAAHERAIAELTAELERLNQQLTGVQAEQAHALDAAAANHAAALDQQASLHAAALGQRDQEHAAALAKYDQDLAAALTRRDQKHAAALTRRDREHAAALAQHDHDHAAARALDAAAHQEALATIAELESELERQTKHHGETLAGARKQLDDLVEQHEHAKATLIDQHRYALDELAQRHAAERAQANEDQQRVIEGLEHAVTEARAAALHQSELSAHAERAERAATEHRTQLLAAKRALDEAIARHRSEREAAEREAAKALGDQKAQHERALALASGELQKTRAMADVEHGKAIAALHAEHEHKRKETHAQHAKLVGELTTERDELRRGLSSARDATKRSEAELGAAVQTIADRNAELRVHVAAIAERDQRIAELRREFEALEQENATYQDQVLRAYQKIKTDEAMVARAKKAMAIALTVLDDQGTPKAEPT
ncbi:MAG TPA: response regulator [Kofleriaceae bacterium]|nr:response regulator [Kofleriaceae bacterium]